MTILRIKPGVGVGGLRPEIVLAIQVFYSCYSVLDKDGEAVITSCTEGKHMRGSRHYVGLAFDGRIRTLKEGQPEMLADMLRECLTKEYDVVLESTHIHVEYDPEYLG